MGEIKEFTGISSPYEEPENPDLILDTSKGTVEECVLEVMVCWLIVLLWECPSCGN